METGKPTADRVPIDESLIRSSRLIVSLKKKELKWKEESKISSARGTCKVAGQKEMESERLVRSKCSQQLSKSVVPPHWTPMVRDCVYCCYFSSTRKSLTFCSSLNRTNGYIKQKGV